MIREATAEDIPAVMEMGKAFAEEAGITAEIGWDDDSVRDMLEGMIESPDGILLVGNKGMIGGVVSPHPFNRNVKVFMELFWRSHSREGVRLLKEAERLAKERGAIRSVMVGMARMPDVGPLYERMGYARYETNYIKEL